MSFISDNVKYQPPFNDVLDEVEQLKVSGVSLPLQILQVDRVKRL